MAKTGKPWTRGTVKVWHSEDGWGVLTAPDVAGDVFAHFSVIQGIGYGEPAPGEPVEFRFTDRGQDGCPNSAVVVRRVT